MKEPRVAIIILNWNNWRDTIECLDSLLSLKYQNHTTIIFDNGSRNDSVKKIVEWIDTRDNNNLLIDNIGNGLNGALSDNMIPKDYDYQYIVMGNRENLGYAGGNNKAMKIISHVDYDYFWLLNNDTIVSGDSLSELVKCSEDDHQVGMVVSNLVHTFGGHKTFQAEAHFKNLLLKAKTIGGGSILIKNKCLRDVGPIDENYFCYKEEIDWSLLARRKGWKLIRNFRSVVFHKWGGSTKSNRIEKKFLWKKRERVSWEGYLIPGYYESRNGIYFTKKNQPFLLIPYVIFRTLHLLIQICLYDDHKWGRIKVISRGTWDGIRGRMGRADISL